MAGFFKALDEADSVLDVVSDATLPVDLMIPEIGWANVPLESILASLSSTALGTSAISTVGAITVSWHSST